MAASAMAAGMLAGLLTGRWVQGTAPVWVAGFLVLEFSTGNLSASPLAGTLGYANAEAALAVQVGALALVAGATVGRRWSWLWLVSAVAAMSVAPIVRSAAGVGLAGLVLLVGAYSFLARRPSARWAPLVGASAILGAGAVRWR